MWLLKALLKVQWRMVSQKNSLRHLNTSVFVIESIFLSIFKIIKKYIINFFKMFFDIFNELM